MNKFNKLMPLGMHLKWIPLKLIKIMTIENAKIASDLYDRLRQLELEKECDLKIIDINYDQAKKFVDKVDVLNTEIEKIKREIAELN